MQWQRFIFPVLIAAVGLLAYSNSFSVPFVYDDLGAIVNNQQALRSFDFGNWRSYVGLRSLPAAILALNYQLGGLTVWHYHVVNVAIHIFNGWLVYWLCILVGRRFTLTREIGLFAALLFVAHPITTEAVTYIVQRTVSLTVMFYLLAVGSYVKFRLYHQPHSAKASRGRPPAVVWAALSLLATLAAMHSKQIALTIPIMIAWVEFCFFATTSRSPLPPPSPPLAGTPPPAGGELLGRGRKVAKKILLLLPWLLLLAYIPWRMMSGATAVPVREVITAAPKESVESLVVSTTLTEQTGSLPRPDYLVTGLSVLLSYLRLLVWPLGQNIDHDPVLYRSLWAARPWLGLFVLIGLAVAAWLLRRRRALLSFGLGWFFVTWALESSVYPLVEVMVEYRLYLPLVGLSLVAGDVFGLLATKVPRRELAVIGGAVVVCLVGLTWQRNTVWQDPVVLWQDAALKSPQKARPRHNLGVMYLLDREDYALAGFYFRQAIERDPYNAVAYANLGTALFKQGRWQEGEEYYRKALDLRPQLSALAVNLAQVYIQQHRWAEARVLLEALLAEQPGEAAAHNALGIVYVQRGDLARAQEQFERALTAAPDHEAARKNLEAVQQARK